MTHGYGGGEILMAEDELLTGLRDGDEAAFEALVLSTQSAMAHVAEAYLSDGRMAAAIVELTWVTVLTELDKTRPDCSVRTLIFRTLVDLARAAAGLDIDDWSPAAGKPSVDPDRFFGPDHGARAGHWVIEPPEFDERHLGHQAEERLLGRVRKAVAALDPAVGAVVRLRDAEGWPAADVCEVLEIDEVTQRALLHRGRTYVRTAIEEYAVMELKATS